MKIDFDGVIDRTNTYCTQWDYVEDRFGKPGLLPFTISDMDFASPVEIQETLKARIEHPVYGYSRWNHDDYKQAICHWYESRFYSPISPEWIAYSPSVIYSIATLISLTSEPGEGVLLFTPAYDGFFGCIEHSGRQMVTSELINDNGYFEIDKQDFEAKIAHCRTLLLCNPHNPVGRVWQKEELAYLLDVCQRHDVFVISDDIHMDICFGVPYYPVTSLTTHKVAICTSASKAFNTPALGGSYVLIPEADLHARFMQVLKLQQGLSSPPIFGVLATITAYQQCGYWIDELKTYLQDNLHFVQLYLHRELPELTMQFPEGLYFAWIDYSAMNVSAQQLKAAMVNAGVAIMTGDVYGDGGKHYLRLNVACPREKLTEGLVRLQQSVTVLRSQNG
ncbi:putative bifunctional protein: repressor/cystathionine beta-lyase [Vibrio ichthyoenteri ATCC 700023]|uniref:cysteine-S-conjugate beta-lyase n=1 Tax=Vibrio ichthyoenteri ATCC 700023 TaxID=870968 RepID=F9S358_9VIBR|nr:MalY/PatB family protein [Vibrio ichthyoenteri]EGU38236.1 putative bifunctional protein: repressor/cystathionine beta-lyase [Vibrio ichthyoenteri ATCC 700023]